MTILLAIIIAFTIAAVAVVVTLLLRRTTISIIVRKDPDMATIKARLFAAEASLTIATATIASMQATIAAHADTISAGPTADAVTALAGRMDAVEAEIGFDPTVDAAPADAPAPAEADPSIAPIA